MPVDPHRNSRFGGGLETQVAGDELALVAARRCRPLMLVMCSVEGSAKRSCPLRSVLMGGKASIAPPGWARQLW